MKGSGNSACISACWLSHRGCDPAIAVHSERLRAADWGGGGHAPRSRGTGGFAEGPRGHVVHAAAAEASSGTTRSRCTRWEVTATVINANHAILLLLTRKKGGTVRTPRRWCRRRPWSRRVPAARGEAPAGPTADPRARPCRRPVAGPHREQRCPAKRYERPPAAGRPRDGPRPRGRAVPGPAKGRGSIPSATWWGRGQQRPETHGPEQAEAAESAGPGGGGPARGDVHASGPRADGVRAAMRLDPPSWG